MAKPYLKENFPYLFTLLVGFIAFQYNVIADHIKSTPFLEYSISETPRPGHALETTDTCEIANISDNTMFKNLDVIISFKTASSAGNTFSGEDIVSVHPASPDSITKALLPEKAGAIFKLHNFQPDTHYQLCYMITRKVKTSDSPYIYINAAVPVVLEERSWFSILIKNNLMVNGIILLLLVITLIPYFIYLSKSKNETIP